MLVEIPDRNPGKRPESGSGSEAPKYSSASQDRLQQESDKETIERSIEATRNLLQHLDADA